MAGIWWCCGLFLLQASVSFEWLVHDSLSVALSVSHSSTLQLLEQIQASCFSSVLHTSKQAGTQSRDSITH